MAWSPLRRSLVVGGLLVLPPLLGLSLLCCVVVDVGVGGGSQPSRWMPATGEPAVPGIWARSEVAAAARCTELSWSTLGALGWLASRSGRVAPGQAPPWWRWDGGPFGVVVGDGARHLSPERAARRAALQICEAARQTGSLTTGLSSILGSSSAALEVEVLALGLRDAPDLADGDATAIDFAVHALGTPYQWGGNGPATYDCSGLTVAAERSAGRAIPRTAQAQHDAARPEPTPGGPGNLAFFGSGTGDIGHVGLIIGGGLMIDAPHTGAVVRIEPYDWSELIDEGSFG